VGVVSYQDGETIDAVTTAVRDGMTRHFAGLDSRLVLADTGSGDGTARERATPSQGLHNCWRSQFLSRPCDVLELPYHGIPGKARALHAILTTARDLGARACVML
jgi:hypothetical protein